MTRELAMVLVYASRGTSPLMGQNPTISPAPGRALFRVISPVVCSRRRHSYLSPRRAERRLVSLPTHGRSVRPEVRQFVNRLSDLLWLLAREAEQ